VEGYPGIERYDTGHSLVVGCPAGGSFIAVTVYLNTRGVPHTFSQYLFSVQSDCPHREKLVMEVILYCDQRSLLWLIFDMHDLYAKTGGNFADEAQPDGALPERLPMSVLADNGVTGTAGPYRLGDGVAAVA